MGSLPQDRGLSLCEHEVLTLSRRFGPLKCTEGKTYGPSTKTAFQAWPFAMRLEERNYLRAQSGKPARPFLSSATHPSLRRPVSLQTLPGLSECECQKTLAKF